MSFTLVCPPERDEKQRAWGWKGHKNRYDKGQLRNHIELLARAMSTTALYSALCQFVEKTWWVLEILLKIVCLNLVQPIFSLTETNIAWYCFSCCDRYAFFNKNFLKKLFWWLFTFGKCIYYIRLIFASLNTY